MEKIVDVKRGTAIFAKGQTKVRAVLDAAFMVLIESGTKQFSMNQVAARSSLRLSHVQYYFPSRLDLLKALLQRQLDTYEVEMKAFLANNVISSRKKTG